jgi:glutamine cyclotransferase
MKSLWVLGGVLLCIIVISVVAISGIIHQSPPDIPVYSYEVVFTYPHDRFAFTEGLAYIQGNLIEGTGLKGNSTLREVNLTTGEIISIRHLPNAWFGEGVTVFGTKIAQVTEDSGFGITYDLKTLEPLGTFNYSTEGWGITWDGQYLIMSDGTSNFYFIDPDTYREVRRIAVQAQGVPVKNLNELEYIKGEIYANIWPTDTVARISPQTGEVTGWIDFHGLLPAEDRKMIGWPAIEYLRGNTSIPFEQEASLNGIAYDPGGDRLFVTGKLWPELFEVRIVPT